jgi:hypothetical protein
VVEELKERVTSTLFDSITIQVDEDIKLTADFSNTKSTVASKSVLQFDCLDSLFEQHSAD